MSDLLLVEKREAAAALVLNRPEKRNALSIGLRERLRGVLEELADDPAVRVVWLTGAGSAFCAGMDRTQFGGDKEHKQRLYASSVGLFDTLRSFPKPTIAAVNGPAMGGGFALALCCDIRIASENARFSFSEIRLGVPVVFSWIRAAVGDGMAREIALTGRVIGAEEGLRLGLLGAVLPPEALLERAWKMAGEIAALPQAAVEATKSLIVRTSDRAPEEGREIENRLFRESLGLEDGDV